MSQLVVAVVSPGTMGAAIGARLHAHGVRVVTPAGRSAASRARAQTAGIEIVEKSDLGTVDFVFSIVPPSEAVATATHVADHIGASTRRPLYIDWNAVSPAKAQQCDAIISAAGGRFADGGIIGLPPGPEGAGPLLFSSGPNAADLARLDGFGIRFKRLDGPVGVASSLKMSYAGITKGTIALGAAMLLAAHRAGCDEVLVAEMAVSQAQSLAGFQRSIPDMFGKAERWAPEIEEIAAFIGADHAEAGIYAEMASFYRAMAADAKGDGTLAATLSEILKPR